MIQERDFWKAHLAGLKHLDLLDKTGLWEVEEELSRRLENGEQINCLDLYYDLVCDWNMDRGSAMIIAGLTPYELALAEAGYSPYHQDEIDEYHRIHRMTEKQVEKELEQLTCKL
ncbi:MAG: hypothetical protein AAB468_03180 [Patescibacteria group bacterium]